MDELILAAIALLALNKRDSIPNGEDDRKLPIKLFGPIVGRVKPVEIPIVSKGKIVGRLNVDNTPTQSKREVTQRIIDLAKGALIEGAQGKIVTKKATSPWYPGCMMFRIIDNNTSNADNENIFELVIYPDEPPDGFLYLLNIRLNQDVKGKVPGAKFHYSDTSEVTAWQTGRMRAWNSEPGHMYKMDKGKAVKIGNRTGFYVPKFSSLEPLVYGLLPQGKARFSEAYGINEYGVRTGGIGQSNWVGERMTPVVDWLMILESIGWPINGIAGYNLPVFPVAFRHRTGYSERAKRRFENFWNEWGRAIAAMLIEIVAMIVSAFGGRSAGNQLSEFAQRIMETAWEVYEKGKDLWEAYGPLLEEIVSTYYDVGTKFKEIVDKTKPSSGSTFSIKEIVIFN